MLALVLILHCAATFALMGLIWTIQLVHYPLMANVPAEAFRAYETRHTSAITPLVAPLMFAELITAGLLWMERPAGLPPMLFNLSLALVAVVWLSTALLQVPCHSKLAAGFDTDAHRRLVRSNWIRTLAWTARSCLMSLWLHALLKPLV